MPLPKLFIGSSKEAQEAGLLKALQDELQSGLNSANAIIDLVPWPESSWANLNVAVQSLMENLVDYSYGVFVLSADDEVSLRGTNQYAARDNVIFEFGLFLAHLGPQRTFLIGPENTAKTEAITSFKIGTASQKSAKKLPLRILTDLGSAYRKGSYTIDNQGGSPIITCHVAEVIAAIKDVEETAHGLSPPIAKDALDHCLQSAKTEISKPKKCDDYYSSQFSSHFREVARLKAQATSRSVQNIVQDLLLTLERVPDFCEISQLATLQSWKEGVHRVWVFADEPLEFRTPLPTGSPAGRAYEDLRATIKDNLRNNVEYVYFVGPGFTKDRVDHLVDIDEPDRKAMLQNIHVVKVHSQLFSTYFTLHFHKGQTGPKAIYMSSVMRDWKDVLIQVSDDEHVDRIYNRIHILLGRSEHGDSPRVTSHVL